MRFRLVVTCLAISAAMPLQVLHASAQDLCFDAAVNYSARNLPYSVFAADLDGDGDRDLAVANFWSGNVSVLKNNGTGTFAAAVNYTVEGTPYSVFAADLDGDGDRDLAIANYVMGYISVLKNDGNGNFAAAVNYSSGGAGYYIVFAADLDGDSALDLAVANGGGVAVLKNNGNGNFTAAVNYAAGVEPRSVFAADLDGDGDCDLAVANSASNNVSILKNNGDGTLATAVNFAAGSTPQSVYGADLDGDSALDLAVANASGENVSVLINCTNLPPAAICVDVQVLADGNCQTVVTPQMVNNGSSDPEDGTNLTLELVPPGPFPLGAIPVQLIVTDTQGAKDTCQATITVDDYTPPVPTCPSDLIVGTDPGQCAAVVSWVATATDNCPGVGVVCSPPSGSTFPKGVNPVQCIATDASGNKDTCYFNVTVYDAERPVVTCLGDINVGNAPGQCGAPVTYTAAVTDNCPGAAVFSYSPPSGSFLPVGVTQVRVIATDASGNKDTCFFNVTVNDTEAPVLTCPGDIKVNVPLGQIGALVDFASSAADNCTGTTTSCNPASGSFFPVGVTVVTCIASDQAGYEDTCSFNVTVSMLCACDCHGDPAPIGSCNGVADVLDVSETINVAFRGAPSIFDPNTNCPFQTTDVGGGPGNTCDGVTSVIDVVKVVNVAFRGASPVAEFCNPCNQP